MMTPGMYSSKTDLWSTPQLFFDGLHRTHNFTLDVCATDSNAKCARYFTEQTDGLSQQWEGSCWCNPPYGREIGKWIAKASLSASLGNPEGCSVVALLPARTDTRWFHDHIYNKPGVRVEYVKGRLKFGDGKNPAPFPSMLVFFNC